MNFGASALETENKDLKRQLFQKDANISSVQNELFKLREDLTDTKRARTDALYQLGLEAEKFRKADEQLVTTTAELKSYRIRLSNADSALLAAQQAASTSLKSAKQDAVRSDLLGAEGAAELAQAKAERAALEKRVKALEREVVEANGRAGPVAQAAGGGPRSGLPVAASRLPQSKGRRRSSSTSTFAPPPPPAAANPAEVDVLKAKLAKTASDLLHAQNAHNAADRLVLRERAAAADALDEVRDELERARWEKEDVEGRLRAFKEAAGRDGADAFAGERGELKGQVGVLEGRVAALQATVEAREAELKDLATSTSTTIASLSASLSTAQSALSSAETRLSALSSDLLTATSSLASSASLSSDLASAQSALETADSAREALEQRKGELEGEVAEAQTVRFGVEQEREELRARVKELEGRVEGACRVEEEKRDLDARLTALQTTLATSDAALASARTTAADLQDQLDASQSACLDAEAELSRLAAELALALPAEAASELRAKLDQALLDVRALEEDVRVLRGEMAAAEDGHRRVVEVLREDVDAAASRSADEAAALERERAEHTAALGKLAARLAAKDDEVKELSRALMAVPSSPARPATARTPSPPPALAAPAVAGALDRALAEDGALRLTEDEAAGVARMEDAIVRLRAERDGLRAEREDLQRSIRFSEAETRAAESHLASVTEALSFEQQEHAALQLISSDALTLAETLQAELDVARPAIGELEALRDELFGSLEAADQRARDGALAEEQARAGADELRAELDAVRGRIEVVERELAETVGARDRAVEERDEKEAALARAAEEMAAAGALDQALAERDAALQQVSEKDVALAAALEAAAAAAVVVPPTASDAAPEETATRALPAAAEATAPAASPSVDVAALVKDKEALEARVQRRNASVEKQQHELAKLKTAHALLKDSFDDLEEDLAALTAEKAALAAEVSQHLAAQAALTADLDSARSAIQHLETAVAVASAGPADHHTDEQVAALVGVLFSERAAQRGSPAVPPSSTDSGAAHDLLAVTAARLETTVDELSAARGRTVALEAQLAREDAELHALLETTTARLEAVEAELQATADRSSADTASLERANTHLAGRLDATTASLNARAVEVLGARSSMRALLTELHASAAGLEAMGEESLSLRAAQAQLAADNDALRTQLETAQAELEAKVTESVETKENDAASAVASDLEAEIARLTGVVATTSAALEDKEAALVRSAADADRHASDLALVSDAKAALEQQVVALQSELRDVQAARDLLESDQVALKDEIAALKSALGSAAPSDANRALDGAAPNDDLAQVKAQFQESEAKHGAALDLLNEAEQAIASLQAQLTTSEEALAALRSSSAGPHEPETPDLASQLAETEAAHQALIAAHEETVASLAASRQAELDLQDEAASQRAQLDDVLEGLSKLQRDHASIVQAKSIAESHVAQIVASKEDAVRQVQDEHAKALALVERAKAVKAEQAGELERELNAAKASLSEAIARSEAQDGQIESQGEDLARLHEEVRAAKEAVDAGAVRLSATEDTIRQLETDKAAAVADLEAIRVTLTEQTSVVQERERLHAETMQKIDRLQAHVANVETKLDAAELRLGRQKTRHDDEVAALERSLAEASAASGAPAEGSVEEKIADLEDHVERLIASLDQKNVEVEEADDKIISMLKEKKKFERKIELLQKKLDKATAAAPAPAASATPAAAVDPTPVARAPLSPLNPTATAFVSTSPARAVAPSPAAAPAPAPAKPANMFVTPFVPSHAPSSSISSSQYSFTPKSSRPIASSRRVSGEYSSGTPGTPRSRVASAPVIPSPRAVYHPASSENVAPSPALGAKRSRPADLEQLGPSNTVTAICAPAPSPAALSSILAPTSGNGNTPRRAPLLTCKVEKGFTPKRSAEMVARAALLEKRDAGAAAGGLGAGIASRLGGMTLGREGVQQSTGGLKTSTGDLMSRLAAMRR